MKGIVRIADHYYKEFTVERVTVYACKMAGDKVLAKTVWPGKDTPLIVLPLDESIFSAQAAQLLADQIDAEIMDAYINCSANKPNAPR